MTPARARALAIIREHGPITPRPFARKMWPDSPKWEAHTPCGPKGVSKGGGMNLAGGAFLGKLARDGLISRRLVRRSWGTELTGYTLTTAGRKALEEHDAAGQV